MELPSNLQKDILHSNEIASYMGVSRQTIITSLHKGLLKGTQLGVNNGKWAIRKEDFIEYLTKNFNVISKKREEVPIEDRKVVDITSNFKRKTLKNNYNPVTCRVSADTLEKIDRERGKTLPIICRSTYVGKVLNELYGHRKI